jgi:hypothetical protein
MVEDEFLALEFKRRHGNRLPQGSADGASTHS